MMDMALWVEPKKSTEGDLVPMKNNHVAVLMNYIVWAILRAENAEER